jgi:hypothetical protein
MFGGPMRDTVASAHSLTPQCVFNPPSLSQHSPHATYGRLTVLPLSRNGSVVLRNLLCKCLNSSKRDLQTHFNNPRNTSQRDLGSTFSCDL